MIKKHKYILFLLSIIIAFVFIFIGTNTGLFTKGNLKGKNIILITLDTTRADHISAYGKGRADTPNLDRIAKEGVLFENCISQTPLTLPAHISILTSTYPMYNNIRDNVGLKIPQKLEFLSETLKENGFKTSAFISSFVLHSKWGVDQGFDTYSDDLEFSKFSMITVEQRGDITLNKAREWINKNKKEKFFSWVHLYDPHTPYAAPAPYDKKYPNNPYRGEIEYMDDLLGKFFQFLKDEDLYDDSIIVIVGDHGEALGQHGEKDHGFFIYNESIHVPLMIRTPDTYSKKKIRDFVELVDLAPTILEMQDIKNPRAYQGESLLELMNGKKERKNKIAYTESFFPRFHFGWSELKGFYFADHYKYIIAPREELYDLKNDPGEENNIISTNPRILKKHKGIFKKFMKLRSKNALKIDSEVKVSSADMDKFKSLGYLSNNIDTSNKLNLLDPKDKIHIIYKISKAVSLMDEFRKYDEAIVLLEEILEEDENVLDAMIYLGNAYNRKRMFNKALYYYRKILTIKPDKFNAMFNILNTLVYINEVDKAFENAKEFLKKFPDDFILLNKLGNIYFRLKQPGKALEIFKKVISREPTNPIAFAEIGRVYLSMGKYKEARENLEKAKSFNPKQFDLYFLFGLLEDKMGNKDAAIKYYKEEISINPNSSDAMYNLAIELTKSGNIKEAERLFRRVIKIKPWFNFPYFMVAKSIFEEDDKLEEARKLCEKGIKLKPFDKYTVYGHLLLSEIYHRKGDDITSQKYYDIGIELKEKLRQ